MDSNNFKSAIADFENFNGEQYKPSAISWLFDNIKNYDNETITKSLSALKANGFKSLYGSKLPAPGQIVVMCQQEQARIDKEEDKKVSQNFWSGKIAKSVHAKEALDGIKKIITGEYNRSDYLKWIREMQKKYPGLGWDDTEAELKQYYHKNNLKFQE